MLLTPTQQAIADSVREFAQERIHPHAQRLEAAGCYPPELFQELAELGLMGMTVPEDKGGAGADYVQERL